MLLHPSIDKSTTGRSAVADPLSPQTRVVHQKPRMPARIQVAKVGFRLLDAVAPLAAGRLAADLFTRPRRRAAGPLVPDAPPLTTHGFTLRDGGPDLAVWDWGEGPTVLLAHGWDGCAAQMASFVAPLVRAEYFVAALDLPAHGSSAGTHTNIAEMAEALVRAGRRLGPVHAVIAHSMGGAAVALALQRGLRAKRAVFLAAPAEMPPFLWRFAASLGLGARGAAALVGEIDRRIGGFASMELPRLCGTQTARLLLLHDPADREVPFSESERIAAAWPGARLHSVPGRGHLRMLGDPEVVRAAVAFVREDRSPLSLAG
jgi:pimeloyl-ACP methyl ester carboxylesterase